MKKKGPKTARGWERKFLTGDGRKNLPIAGFEQFGGKKKRKRK